MRRPCQHAAAYVPIVAMVKRCDDAPKDEGLTPHVLGHPVLPVPSAAALARAAPLFAQLTGLPAPQSKAPVAALPPAKMHHLVFGARAYPKAIAALARVGVAVDIAPEPPIVGNMGTPKAPTAPTAKPAPVGQGHAWVRASVPAPKPAPPVPQQLLEDLAAAAQVGRSSATQVASFVVEFREELLGELRCTVQVDAGGALTATFIAADAHTARLLAAEAGRLSAQFAQRGLNAVHVVIEQQTSADDPAQGF